MGTKSQKLKYLNKKNETILLLLGITLFTLWLMLAAPFSAGVYFCGIMWSTICSSGSSWSIIPSLGPSMAGALFISLGLVRYSNMAYAAKVICVVLLTSVLSFVAYWATWMWIWASPLHLIF